jgi:hypothetical protein
MRKARFWQLGGCDETHGGWGQQGIEVACKAWLSGGRLVVNKKTWFAHWFRGGSGPGFPYHLSGKAVDRARAYSKDLWLNDRWPQATRKFQWLVDKFHPPGWEQTEVVHDADKRVNRLIRRTFSVLAHGALSPIGCRTGVREDLPAIWRDAGYHVGAELGVWRGSFSEHILKTMPEVHLHSIDPWEVYSQSKITTAAHQKNYAQAMARLQPFVDAGRCDVHKARSTDMAAKFADGSLDFVFIDGDHSFDGCVLDLIQWVPKVRKGGMVAVHDYCLMRRGRVIEAVDAYTRSHMIDPWFVTSAEQIRTAFWVRT